MAANLLAISFAALKDCPKNRIVHAKMTFSEFRLRTLRALAQSAIGERPIFWMARNWNFIPDVIHEGGLFAEIGVYQGSSLKFLVTELRDKRGFGGPILGFDTFTGLPSYWRDGYPKNFYEDVDFVTVKNLLGNGVELHKGLFHDAAPSVFGSPQLKKFNATLVHIDTCLFMGAASVLSILSSKIVPGTLLLFGNFMGYEEYDLNEILALYLWMRETGSVLCAVAAYDEAPQPNHEGQELPLDFRGALLQIMAKGV